MKTKKSILITFFITAVAGAIVWRIFLAGQPQMIATGGPLDIKLIAIRPDMGDDCYDLTGKKMKGVSFPVMPAGHAGPVWHEGQHCMDFIFEVPLDTEIFLPYSFFDISANGKKIPSTSIFRESDVGRGPIQMQVVHQGRRILIVRGVFASYKFKRFLRRNWKRGISNIDLKLSYYRDDQLLDVKTVIKGPFKNELKFKQGNGTFQFKCSEYYGRDLLGAVDTDLYSDLRQDFFVYDKSGQCHLAKALGDHDFGKLYRIYGVTLSQIESIAYGKDVHTRTFKNVNVDCRGRKQTNYAPYLDKMAQRLGVEIDKGGYIRSHKYSGWQEALKVIDVARGDELLNAVIYICEDKDFDYDKLDNKTQKFIKEILMSKIGTSDLLYILCLGIACNLDEFVDIALDAFESKELGCYGNFFTKRSCVYYIFEVFRKRQIRLNPNQLKRAKQIYRKTKSHDVQAALRRCDPKIAK